MRTTQLACLVIAGCFVACVHSVARDRLASESWPNQALTLRVVSPHAPSPTNPEQTPSDAASLSAGQIIERVFKRESQQQEIIRDYAPIIETYIQEQQSNPVTGTAPRRDFYFLG